MEKITYKRKELKRISWKYFEKCVNKIYDDITKYLKEQNLKVDVIVPIFRGGGIPGITLAYKLNVVRVLPFQYKYLYKIEGAVLKKMLNNNFSALIDFKKENPVILVVEGNHSTGLIASNVVNEIRDLYPKSKILYASIGRDYYYKDTVRNIDFSTYGYYTNENRKLSLEECNQLGISVDKVYVFPWESTEEEFAALNGLVCEYGNGTDA